MTKGTALRASIEPITARISVKGAMHAVPGLRVNDVVVVVSGHLVRFASIFDAYWLEAAKLPDPNWLADQLRSLDHAPDLFCFTQRVPDTEPRFSYRTEWDNVAVIPVSSHGDWLQNQISAASRRNIRASAKKGVSVRICEFDDNYVRGIMAISNESPIRAGRKYWHYGKDFAAVAAEQGTYRTRSTFLGAYLDDEMIGYLKLVWDERTAAIMQIVSKMSQRDKRPNNALLSEAVKLCAERGIGYLQYERFVYGNNTESSLTRFKKENGFVRMDVPSYYIPLTRKGRLALSFGLHKNLKDRIPRWASKPLLELRNRWYARLGARRLASAAPSKRED